MDGRPLTQRNHFLPLCFLLCFFDKISILKAHGSPCCIWQTACNISFYVCAFTRYNLLRNFRDNKEEKGSLLPTLKIRASLRQQVTTNAQQIVQQQFAKL